MPYFEDENTLIAKIAKHFPRPPGPGVRLGMGDDAAIWQSKRGFQTILTSDWFIEGSHFLRDKHPADSVGWKCLARAASDVAAMGGTPRCFLLNLALPSDCTGKWLGGFLGGLRRASDWLGCSIAGGDTTRNQRILINITVIGAIATDRAIVRSGARPDDLLFVSGTLGEAELGLRQLRKSRSRVRPTTAGLRKHLYPEPRVALGSWLAREGLASAMMDISDGLSTDLARLCEASGVGAVIGEDALPWPERAPKEGAVNLALHGGDDYELLFTVHPSKVRRLKHSYGGVPITHVGAITKRRKLLLVKENGVAEELLPGGWDPFRRR